ncbi:MAG: UDP-N-acetylmuramoyl-L-alanyl-D-glutamate--2,6-diaminopimelate ligase [Candidatus Bipolaricaulota bacterium]|nr:UDP-N-acetylmuramoyl-L-alanyl-D-glutamate--2,6-diaminopimelate ligase [Candidatus Bipolaricaulota bacterium]
MTRRLIDLACAARFSCPSCDAEITSVTDDSRQVEPGTLFVAHRGIHADGHDFLADALARGAAAVVAEHPVPVDVPSWIVPDGRAALAVWAATFYDHPSRDLFTFGVTGTNGKTSVCHFIAHLMGEETTAVLGTVANFARGLRALTTPSSPVVQQFARQAVEQGCRHLVVEASSIGLEQRRLDEVDFRVGVFTNLTRDHLDLHGTMAAYGEAKAILFRRLRPDGCAVLNADDAFSATLRAACRCPTLTYGVESNVDLVAEVRSEDRLGIAVEIRWRGDRADVFLPLHGRHGVSNALAASGAALAAGRDFPDVAAALETLPPVLGRWQAYARDDGIDAVVDFAHTPDGLEQVLASLRRLYPDIVVVFGCAGGSDRGKRAEMGEIAGRLASLVVLTTDNPKQEDPDAIAAEIAAGVARTRAESVRILDRNEAIAVAVARATPGGVVLLAGKGHETYQIVRGAFVPHSDVAALEGLGFRPLGMRQVR